MGSNVKGFIGYNRRGYLDSGRNLSDITRNLFISTLLYRRFRKNQSSPSHHRISYSRNPKVIRSRRGTTLRLSQNLQPPSSVSQRGISTAFLRTLHGKIT